jgi:KaiC/GvpD/RAD55 family RecA-like ATPase
MAPRASSRKQSSSRSSPTQRSYAEQIESAEVKRSRKAAILQLTMGRLAHTIGIASGLALALTAMIAYGLINWEFLRSAPQIFTTLKWIIPLVAGVAVAAIALAVKWEPYLTDREESHFVMSIVALVAPIFIIALIVLDEYNYVELGRPAWLYPASLLGICLTEISLAMTWEGQSSRRTISIVSAVFPLVLLVFPMLFRFTPEELASILPMGYLGSAVAIQLSGAMLHIIASSTSVQQREVLKASDSKLREQLQELEKKRHAVMYREDALRSRESDVETYEKRLTDEMASVEERKTQVAAAEAEMEQRFLQARDERQKLVAQQAGIEDAKETIQLRQSDFEGQRRELEKRTKALLTKEDAVSAREREANRILIDSQAKERDIKNRLSEVEAEETALGTMRKEIDDLQEALADREKQIGVRESALDMKVLEIAAARDELGTVAKEKTSVKTLEQQLLMRQESLAEKEIAIKTSEDGLRQKSERAERLVSRADKQMNELVEKENAILAREKTLADKESQLRAEVEGLNAKLEDMQSARETVTDREKQYHSLTETTRTKLSAVTAQEEEIARKMAALERRENKIKELETRLRTEHETMNSKLRELLEKEKDLIAKEDEMGLRHAELKAMERDVLESVDEVEQVRTSFEVPEEDEQAKTMEYREKHLMEREQEMKSRLYQREKELEKREQSLRAHLKKDIEGMEEAVEEEYAEAKVKTGIDRLDDLLMGGMPFGSNITCVGPPFIGKEVAMMLFLAEGLKKGVPVVIVTTSKPPDEISKDMAPILPTFKEFEQLGLVHWVDATGFQGTGSGGQAEPNIVAAMGSGDLDGISKAIDGCVKKIQKQKQPYFRLAYLSLSMSVTQSDEKSSFQFVQNLAGKLRQANAISVYALERGMHTEQQLESIQHHMTGALLFKTDKQKTLISVQGIGDVQIRDWIEYKHTNKAIMIGAFSLERIR